MAVTLTMTGTSQSISATNGNANITFASGVATNWVVGATIQGAQGWFNVGLFSIQPSEIAKLISEAKKWATTK